MFIDVSAVNGPADELVVVLVHDVNLPDGANERTRGHEPRMSKVLA